jgi:hypothetical protein
MAEASGDRFGLEGLENRKLLSASVAADLLSSSLDTGVPTACHAALTSVSATIRPFVSGATKARRVAAVAPTTPLVGAFNVAGTYSHPIGPGFNPDAGNSYSFTGSGRKRSLGSFTMAGDLLGIGFIQSGRFRGYVTLTSSQGTIDLRLLGPEQAPGPLPETLSFKIVGGSGAYALANGKGAIAVSASDTTQRFVFRFNQA